MAKVRRPAAEWASLIEQWRRSGLSLPEFCHRNGLSRGTMQNWVYKPSLRHAVEQVNAPDRAADMPPAGSPSPGPSPSFLPISIAEPARNVSDRPGVEVVLGPNRRVVVAPGFDPETLRLVVAVLEGRPC